MRSKVIISEVGLKGWRIGEYMKERKDKVLSQRIKLSELIEWECNYFMRE